MLAFVALFDRAPYQKDTHWKMTQIDVIGLSRTLTGGPSGDKNDYSRDMPFCEVCNFAGG